MDIKILFYDTYGCDNSKNRFPHLTVANYGNWIEKENEIFLLFENFAKNIPPFTVELDGFGSYRTDTIYVNVINKAFIRRMTKNLKKIAFDEIKVHKDDKPYFSTDPHITIAMKMSPLQFNLAFPQWQNRQLKLSFFASALTLLRRCPSTGKYEKVAEFPFLAPMLPPPAFPKSFQYSIFD